MTHATAKSRTSPRREPAPAPEAARAPLGEDALARRSLREVVAGLPGRASLLTFRVGRELFAVELAAVEEALELPLIHHVPDVRGALLGVFSHRGRLLPVYSPMHALGVANTPDGAVAIVLRWNETRIGVAVDDVDDVMELAASEVRRPPVVQSGERVLLGVARRGADLVALIDADGLAAACAPPVLGVEAP